MGVKRILDTHIRTLKVVKGILCRIEDLPLDDAEGYAQVTTERFGNNLELMESDEEVFKRRMCMRDYFR